VSLKLYINIPVFAYTTDYGGRLRVFENRIPSRIFVPKGEKIIGDWRKMHSEQFKIFYSSPDIFRMAMQMMTRWVRHVARMAEKGSVCRVLVGHPEGILTLRKPKCKWEDNIQMNLAEIE
jgi:hypothetical protein